MPDKSKLELDKEVQPTETGSQLDASNNKQEEDLAVSAISPISRVIHPRKSALSKREMMEELSRQRFPWDE